MVKKTEVFLFNGSSVCPSLSDDIANNDHGGLIEIRSAASPRIQRHKDERKQSSVWPDTRIRESTKGADTISNFSCILPRDSVARLHATPRCLAQCNTLWNEHVSRYVLGAAVIILYEEQNLILLCIFTTCCSTTLQKLTISKDVTAGNSSYNVCRNKTVRQFVAKQGLKTAIFFVAEMSYFCGSKIETSEKEKFLLVL